MSTPFPRDPVRTENPDFQIIDICFEVLEVLGFSVATFSEELQDNLKKRFVHISGLIYTISIDLGDMERMMLFRKLQFTKYLDLELINQGFEKPSNSKKEDILKAMNLYIENWREITGDD